VASVLGLDVGQKRIGVAVADLQLRFARSLPTIENNTTVADAINRLLEEHGVAQLIVGYPRDINGKAGAQAALTEQFIESLALPGTIQVIWQDETLTSVKAEEELELRGKPYTKGEIDALAALFILEDYLRGLA